MKRYKITVSYLGTNYCGWQTQKNGTSVQSVLENAFSKLFGIRKNRRYGQRQDGCRGACSRTSGALRRGNVDSCRKNSFCDKHYAPGRRQGFELR